MLSSYTISGDIATIAICFVIGILLLTSYVNRTRSLGMFVNIMVSLVIAAVVNIIFHYLMEREDTATSSWIYVLRVVYQALLLDILCLFVLYITEVSGMEHKKARMAAITSVVVLFITVITDIILTASGVGFYIGEDGEVFQRTNVFMIGYILLIIQISIMMLRVRRLVYKRVLFGFYGVFLISLAIRLAQFTLRHSSLTTLTFIFPVLAMLYILHSNPYNVTLGSVDTRAMEDMVRTMYARKTPFIFVSLLMMDYNAEGKELPKEIKDLIRRSIVDQFGKGVLFRIGNGQLVLVVPIRRHMDYSRK